MDVDDFNSFQGIAYKGHTYIHTHTQVKVEHKWRTRGERAWCQTHCVEFLSSDVGLLP